MTFFVGGRLGLVTSECERPDEEEHLNPKPQKLSGGFSGSDAVILMTSQLLHRDWHARH